MKGPTFLRQGCVRTPVTGAGRGPRSVEDPPRRLLATVSTHLEVQESAPDRSLAARRSVAALLAPLDRLAANSPWLTRHTGAGLGGAVGTGEIPRYVFAGPKGGDDPIRVGLFAAIHGDEPEGAYALVRFLEVLERTPELAAGYRLFCYPVCNPTLPSRARS